MRPEPGRSTRPVRTSVPPVASLPRESSWPSRHAPQGAWPREPAQAGRGSAMARAEAVRRSGALHNVCRLPGSPGSGCMAAERAARKRRRCGDTSAAGPTADLNGGAGGNTCAVRGMRCGVPGRKARCAGEIEPSVTTSWSAQAERDRGPRGTPSPRPAGAGFVRHTARFDRATRDGCRGAQAARRTLTTRGRHCMTSSDDVVATAPTRIHRGDREGNLQGRRGGAGEATHVERRVRRVKPSGSTSRLIDSMTFARTSGKRVQDGL